MRIGARLGYSSVGANFLKEENIGNTERINYNGTDPVIANHILEATLSQIVVAPYFAYSFIENLVANIGLNLGFVASSSYNYREELASPDFVYYKKTDEFGNDFLSKK